MEHETIQCPSCEHENAAEARFCEQCGASLQAPETAEQACPKCGEANSPTARFCQSCGETLEADAAAPEAVMAEQPAPAEPEKKARRRLPGWARVVITTLVVGIIAAALGLGFAYASPYINAYMVYSPARMERAGLLAQEFVERVYPAFADAEPDVWVETIDGREVYVVDFLAQDGDQSLGLRILVNKTITAARALEYVELGPPEPYSGGLTIDAGTGEQVQPVLSGGIEQLLDTPRITAYDDLSSLDESLWWTQGEVEISAAGEAEFSGTEPYASRLGRLQELGAGEAFILSLKYSAGAEFTLSLDHGDWNESGFLRMGVWYFDDQLNTNIVVWREGPERIDEQVLDALGFSAGRWYGVLGAVEGEGRLLIMLWDQDDPSRGLSFLKDFGGEGADLSWMMHLDVNGGTVTVDDYYGLAFDGFR